MFSLTGGDLDFDILLTVNFDQAIINDRLMAQHKRAHEITNDLEGHRGTILDFNVEVCHALTSLRRFDHNLKIYVIVSGINNPMYCAALLCLQAHPLSLNVDIE